MASEMMEALMALCQEKHIDELYLLDRLEQSLDMQQVPASKWEFDPVGHYARPDAVRLEVNDI